MDLPGQPDQRRRLQEGLAAGEGDALEQRILGNLREYLPAVHVAAASGIVGLGILAAGTVPQAALGKDREAKARTVDYAFLCNSGDAQRAVHDCTPPPPQDPGSCSRRRI